MKNTLHTKLPASHWLPRREACPLGARICIGCTVNPPHRWPALKILKTTHPQCMWMLATTTAFWFFIKVAKYIFIPKQSFEINVDTRIPDEYGLKTHYYSCETRQLLLRRHVNMADKYRTLPTEINRSFVYLGQILFHCKLRFINYIRLSVPESLP